MTSRLVAWRLSGTTQADEHCRLDVLPTGVSLVGTVLGASECVPVLTAYRVTTNDKGLARMTRVRHRVGTRWSSTTVVRTASGLWTIDGVPARHLDGCTDLDLGCTPATNTLPIRRLELAVGASQTINTAWIRFPELTVSASVQTYSRVGERTYRYASGGFRADLEVDDLGLVIAYDEWRRTGAVDCVGLRAEQSS